MQQKHHNKFFTFNLTFYKVFAQYGKLEGMKLLYNTAASN